MTCGIYRITNNITNKTYIGQSIDIERRFKQHKRKSNNSYISNSIQKYGIEHFTFEILYECPKEELNKEEQKFINLYGSFAYGYNLTKGGDASNEIYTPLSDETKRKISEAHKGKILSDETKQKISEYRKGKFTGVDNPFFGKHHSIETKQKISKANKGRVVSEETRKKLSVASKGRVVSDETRKKLSKSLKGKNKGKKHSFKFRKMMSEKMKGNTHSLGIKRTEEEIIKKMKSTNSTGFYKVYRAKDNSCKNGFIYKYQYYDENNNRKGIYSSDILKLKEKVIENNLKWEVINKELSEQTIKESINKNKNNKIHDTHFYNVKKYYHKDKHCFMYHYKYEDINGKRKFLYSKDLNSLKERVLAKGEIWKKV